MDKLKMREQAVELLACTADKIEEKEIADIKAMYFRNTDRGGGAIIISGDGGILFVDPFFVEYDEHVKKFLNGERSIFETID